MNDYRNHERQLALHQSTLNYGPAAALGKMKGWDRSQLLGNVSFIGASILAETVLTAGAAHAYRAGKLAMTVGANIRRVGLVDTARKFTQYGSRYLNKLNNMTRQGAANLRNASELGYEVLDFTFGTVGGGLSDHFLNPNSNSNTLLPAILAGGVIGGTFFNTLRKRYGGGGMSPALVDGGSLPNRIGASLRERFNGLFGRRNRRDADLLNSRMADDVGEASNLEDKILRNLGIDETNRKAFINGEPAHLKLDFGGDQPMDVFLQKADGRLKSSIFSIKNQDDASTSIKGFMKFRRVSKYLGKELGYTQVELGGLAIHNKKILDIVNNSNFRKKVIEIPEILGGGGNMEYFFKIFRIK